MAKMDDVLNDIDAATNEIAAVVDGLRNDIKMGMTQAEVDAARAKGTGIVTRLKSIAADPNNPVPTPPPEPTPPSP